MSSGRDVMLENWSQEQKQQLIPKKSRLEQLIEFRDSCIFNLEQVNKYIEEENEKETKSL